MATPPPTPPDRPLCLDVRTFGAQGDGRSLDTVAINAAIHAAHLAGGGTVVVPAGDYLSHSIRLRSRVTLQLLAGATLIAADPPREGESGGYDAPEDGPPNEFQDFGHSRFRNSLVWGEELEHVSILGPGRIYGLGLSRGNGRVALPVGAVAPQPAGHLPDVLEADGPVAEVATPPAGPFGYPHPKDTLPAGVGNKAIGLRACRHVILRDLTILHGGHFAVLATACDDLTVDNLLVDTNRDGIDIDACHNVRISRCAVNSPWDDGICIKSSFGGGVLRPVENVTVSDCYVSGFEEGTLYDGRRSRVIRHRGGPIGRIKLGTEGTGGFRNIAITNCVFEFCRGLALEQVDGGFMEDIVVSNLAMREVMNAPIFVRVGSRHRTPAEGASVSARRIRISNIVGSVIDPDHGIFVAGVADNPIESLSLADIHLSFRGGGTAEDARRVVPELPDGYPEPFLFGRLPAWAFFARHARGLTLRDLRFDRLGADARPALWFENVSGGDVTRVRLPAPVAPRDWVLRHSGALDLHHCDGLPDSARRCG
ncbi:MAG: glycosyl hydrolase family 28-related protein [Opitutaceae bacterium]